MKNVMQTITEMRMPALAKAFQALVPALSDVSWNGVYSLTAQN